MHLSINGRDSQVHQTLRAYVEARAFRKMSRVSKRLRSMVISIRDTNGPRGGIDHVIQVIVRLKSGRQIVVRHRAAEAIAGLPTALQRTLRTMRRAVGRHRSNLRDAYRRNLGEHSPM